MTRAPIPLKLKAVMLICVLVFVYASMIALTQLGPLSMVLQMESDVPTDVYTMALPMLLAVVPFTLVLYSSFTFARILVRRSVLPARIYLAILVMLSTVSMLYQSIESGLDALWGLLWILPLAWLFFSLAPRQAAVPVPDAIN